MAAAFALALAILVADSPRRPGAEARARASAVILPGEEIDFTDFGREQRRADRVPHLARYRDRAAPAGERRELRLFEFH
ncbi:hypothetical protein [Parasphingopyxis marina]|uniref:Uncharacterized protein n=1 Tax=Parasphingopyxis marina TaxID=2761622 RepID=A0A842HUZ7_9SPHN|nr:hypothetical protein [Parasphingopyxis marina]MBC2776257.1 hypothetical protein [Parasphingopyxis marina]